MSTPLNASIQKAFRILELITPERPELTASDVAATLGMKLATAHRYLLTLRDIGVLTTTRRGAFGPGFKLVELGGMATRVSPFAARIQPVIDSLRDTLNESVMVCRFGCDGPVCYAVAPANRTISVNIKVGTCLPMVNTAQGKLWLAYMDECERTAWFASHPEAVAQIADMNAFREELEAIRSAGTSRNRGDNEPDIAAVSAPILRPDGRMAMSLSVFGIIGRFDEPFAERARPPLREAAHRLSEMI